MKDGRPSWTARWVASNRLALSEGRPARGDAAAEDRLYRELAIPILSRLLAKPTGMDIRTAFVDGEVVRAFDAGVRQFVSVGAGYDGRALRFSDDGARWIELDHPATQPDKIARLHRTGADTGHITFATADLLADPVGPPLDGAGHDPGRPTLWICEGLFPYLTGPAIESLCRSLHSRSTPDSVLVVNVLVNGAPSGSRRTIRRAVDGILAAVGERRLSQFGPADGPGLLTRTGWTVTREQKGQAVRADGSYLHAIAARAGS